jgi:eukaryotic-like serine/threonine-protein kinase
MLLTPGTRLGPYEILGAIGAGSMGEVYRAGDPRLQREVAIKILPNTFASDPDRRARFEREARVLAALNDPRIAAIYGVEEDPATKRIALVLELVDGPTLQDRLGGGPLPLDEALPAAAQIAGALEAAHERGVVHRDLKPANVKVTPAGNVKVLDFGLAKALDGESAFADDPATSPTITNRATAAGLILGTAAYMAPEQARGRPVDRRADIWAFGAVLFEMLTGARAFPGQTVSDTIAAILTTDPDWTRLPPATPSPVRHLLRRCLDRNPHTRLQSIGEARITLSDPMPREAAVPAATVRSRRSWLLYGALAFAAAVIGAVAGWSLKPGPTGVAAARKLDLAIDVGESTFGAPVLSPDARRVVYIVSGRLFVRALDNPEAHELPGTAGAAYPFWSPDSRDVAYVADGRVWRTSTERGNPVPVGQAPRDLAGAGQGVWTAAGNMILVGGDFAGLYSLPASGGEGTDILPLDKTQETDFHEIAALPAGRGVIFTVHRLAHGPDTIAVFSGGSRHTVLQAPGEMLASPMYAEPGLLLYQRESLGIWAIRFSLDTMKTTGAPFLVTAGAAAPSMAADGTMAYMRASTDPPELTWRSRNGTVETIGNLPAAIGRSAPDQPFRLSPDGRRVAVCLAGGLLWTYDLDRRSTTRLSANGGSALSPMWTPDGGRIIFGSFGRGGRVWNVHAIGSRETREPDRITNGESFTWPVDLSSDGWLLYAEGRAPAGALRVMPLDRAAPSAPLVVPDIKLGQARFSPDGHWVAYSSLDGKRDEVFVRRFPFDQERVMVSTMGGSHPVWATDGRELYFRSGTRLMAVGVTRTPTGLELTTPSTLFTVPPESQFLTAFDVARDGRFLMVRAAARSRIGVLLNWTSELATLEGAK